MISPALELRRLSGNVALSIAARDRKAGSDKGMLGARCTCPSDKGTRHEAADNVLERQFMAMAPNQKWIADVIYIWTAESWL